MQIRLKKEERETIEYRLRLGVGVRAIARTLKRNHSVIGREIARHRCADGLYRASVAQAAADRKQSARKTRKLDKDPQLRDFVVEKLQALWSPEQIARQLKNQPPPQMKGKRVSHETIYQYIYNGEGRFLQLYRYLRVARKRRGHMKARKRGESLILQRISIHERPAHIGARAELGHWESDTVEGRRGKDGYLCVRVERKTRFVEITKLQSKAARETRAALEETILSFPVKTLTFDNGSEGAEHYLLAKEYGIGTFFCDPFASWQKGTVENTNKLIRQYIPKRTDAMAHVTQGDCDRIAKALNDRPRKCLGDLTPNQVMESCLVGGALDT